MASLPSSGPTAEWFDPYHEWLGIPRHKRPANRPPNHYYLLGLDLFEPNPKAISNAADQRIAYLRALQTSRHQAEAERLLGEVAAARICLLDPEKKADYDRQLRAELASREPPNPAPPPLPGAQDNTARKSANQPHRPPAAEVPNPYASPSPYSTMPGSGIVVDQAAPAERPRHYGGIGRLAYWGLLPVRLGFYAFVAAVIQPVSMESHILVPIVAWGVPAVVIITLRLINIGASRWSCLLMVMALASWALIALRGNMLEPVSFSSFFLDLLWGIGLLMSLSFPVFEIFSLAFPEGYADTKKLDATGMVILSFILSFCIVLILYNFRNL